MEKQEILNYIRSGLTKQAIADRLAINIGQLNYWLKKYGISYSAERLAIGLSERSHKSAGKDSVMVRLSRESIDYLFSRFAPRSGEMSAFIDAAIREKIERDRNP
jgi:hypothetical protein